MITKFNENDKVRVSACRVPWDEVAIGTVDTATYNPGLECAMYIVRLESGDLVKCLEEDLEAVEDNVEEPSEDVKSITITEDEFMDKLYGLDIGKRVAETFDFTDVRLCLQITMFASMLVLELKNELFKEKADND